MENNTSDEKPDYSDFPPDLRKMMERRDEMIATMEQFGKYVLAGAHLDEETFNEMNAALQAGDMEKCNYIVEEQMKKKK